MKYTSLDLLKLAGVENPEDKIGKVKVSIGGVTVNKPDHIINIQDEKTVECLVAGKKFVAKIVKQTEEEIKRVAEVKKRKGEALKAKEVKVCKDCK